MGLSQVTNGRRLIILTALVLVVVFHVLLYFIRTQKRSAQSNLKQLILSSFFSQETNTEIRKDASNKTVDCIDWNVVVDLSRHPLGPPREGRQHLSQKNALKEQTKWQIHT